MAIHLSLVFQIHVAVHNGRFVALIPELLNNGIIEVVIRHHFCIILMHNQHFYWATGFTAAQPSDNAHQHQHFRQYV